MTERASTTVRYRLLVKPELGTGLGNIVHVGLDVQYGDQRARLIFEGLPRRVAQIREVLDSVPGWRGGIFDSSVPTTALALRAAMESTYMRRFQPMLVAGDYIFKSEQPIDPLQIVAAHWTEASSVVIYAVMAAVLLVRPQGLFGIR